MLYHGVLHIMLFEEYANRVISVVSRCGEADARTFAEGLAARLGRKLGDLDWSAPEVAIAKHDFLKLRFFNEFRAYVDREGLGDEAMQELGALFS